MDVTQIVLGVVLLAFGTLTLAGPATLVSGTMMYLLTGVTLFIAGYALLIGISQRRYSNRS
ncbi:hypothetical protein [Natronorubrum sulfidifaciens]|uniref:Uncharacterized protein n=1 Tax=Natronorubrum sulfidifaciens JCM 14089 TaxID=1230460 RepID=L9W7N1_9EURY|nr:hypothetical protein [Natronorubrum sulfidifaciens]ELY44343.1 hypothetical protein C495_10589 [Natronorubrum sulfidifaciens JCM 14089]